MMTDDDKVVNEEHRKDISERRTRVFPRRLRDKAIADGEEDHRSGEERRKGDRRVHQEKKD